MSNSKAPEELRAEHRAVLGEALGGVFHELHNQFYWLQFKWQQYVELFGTSPARIDLLNEAAASFFHHLQDALWVDLLIHISRLTDPPKSRGRGNLTFAVLPDLVGEPLKLRNPAAGERSDRLGGVRSRLEKPPLGTPRPAARLGRLCRAISTGQPARRQGDIGCSPCRAAADQRSLLRQRSPAGSRHVSSGRRSPTLRSPRWRGRAPCANVAHRIRKVST